MNKNSNDTFTVKIAKIFKIIIRSVQRNGNSFSDGRSNSFYRRNS